MLDNISLTGAQANTLFLDNALANDNFAALQSLDGTTLGNALGNLNAQNPAGAAYALELISPLVQNMSPLEQANFDRSFSARLDLDCGSFPYGDPTQPKIAYGIPPGYKATNMDPSHRYVLDSSGNLAVNPNYQKALDNSKIDKARVINTLLGIAAASVGIPTTALGAAALVIGSGTAAVEAVRVK